VGFVVFNTRDIVPLMRMFSIIGFAYVLTTMSTFALETILLLESHSVGRALVNIIANIVRSIGAIYLGKLLAKFFS